MLVPRTDPVDFWLYDARVTLDFMSSSFAAAWPHPAVVAKQYAQWPAYGHIFSYSHAATLLAGVREKLAVAQKLDPLETTCTSVFQSDRGGVYRGLGPGEYACYNPVSYAMCSAASPSAPPPASYAVKMAVTIAGNVADFTAAVLTPIRQKVATEAAVPLDAVEATATAGSVKIDFTVNMQSKAAADTALTAITAKLADKTAASTFLSTPLKPVTVEDIVTPTVLVLVSPPPPPAAPPPAAPPKKDEAGLPLAAIIGGAAAGVAALLCGKRPSGGFGAPPPSSTPRHTSARSSSGRPPASARFVPPPPPPAFAPASADWL